MIKAKEITLITHCHATEDCEKVLEAVKKILPDKIIGPEKIHFRKQVLHGHYGNPITIIEAVIRENTEEVLRHIANKMSNEEKKILSVSFDLRYDLKSNKLFLRLSKQDAYNNRVVISDGDDVIKIIVSVKGSRRLEKIKEYFRELGLIN